MTRLLAVPLDASDIFNDFMILQDSYMEPTRVVSDKRIHVGVLINYAEAGPQTDA